MRTFTTRACLLALIAASFVLLPAAAQAAPANSAPPSVTGTAEVGETLEATYGTWTENPELNRYWAICSSDVYSTSDCDQWADREESMIPETELTSGAIGSYLFYVETYGEGDSDPVVAASNAIGPVTDPDHPFGLEWADTPEWWDPAGNVDFELTAARADVGDLSFVCMLDGVPEAFCGSAFTLAVAGGPHTLVVTATDSSQRTETISYSWTASDAPMTRFTQTPDLVSQSGELLFEWEIVGSFDSIECRLDADAWYQCSDQPGWDNNEYIEINSGGEHTFSIRGVTAGDPSPQYQDPITTYTWTIDDTYPTFTTDLPDVVVDASHEVEIKPSEPVSALWCRLDESGTWSYCKKGFTIAGLEDGSHALEVRGRDLAGNENGNYFGFEVDLGATAAIITQKPAHYTNSSNVTIEWVGSSPGATFECRLNEPFWQPCSSPRVLTGLPVDGGSSFNLEIRATKNGRTQSVPSRAHWHVTDHPFELEFDEKPNKVTEESSAYFEVDADEADTERLTFTCSLDGGSFEPCGLELEFDDLVVGEHDVRVRATDGEVTEELSYEWEVVGEDAFVLGFERVPRAVTSESNAEFSWSASEGVSDAACKLDDDEWSSCTASDYHNVSELADGPHTLSVKPIAGDSSEGPAISTSWTVDTVAPVLSLNGAVPDVTAMPAALPITVSEAINRAWCSFDGSEDEYACDIDNLASFIPNGAHSVSIVAEDLAGNSSERLFVDFIVNVGDAPATSQAPVAPPAAPKSQVFPPMTSKQSRVKLSWVCAKAPCKLTANIKVGGKTLKLKTKTVRYSAGSVGYSMSKKVKKWIKAHAGKGKKATLNVTITGADGSSTTTVLL